MATQKQIEFFDKLTEERDFGDSDVADLRIQFPDLNDSSASSWIEKAIGLPKRDSTVGNDVPPPF